MTRLTRDDIVAGAGKRFASHGYHGTSMRDLGEDLGILGSSIYSHVGGKQELLVAVVERGAEFFDEAARRALGSGGDPAETMHDLVEGHVGVLLDHRPEARTYLTEVDFLDEAERERVTNLRSTYEQAFRKTIERGVDVGMFRDDCDPALGTIYVLSVLNAIDRWYDDEGRLGRDEIVEDLYRFVLAALT
ncbi:MAG: TetR/AcrR family transcriptional regulator [Actinomycetota bacterium]